MQGLTHYADDSDQESSSPPPRQMISAASSSIRNSQVQQQQQHSVVSKRPTQKGIKLNARSSTTASPVAMSNPRINAIPGSSMGGSTGSTSWGSEQVNASLQTARDELSLGTSTSERTAAQNAPTSRKHDTSVTSSLNGEVPVSAQDQLSEDEMFRRMTMPKGWPQTGWTLSADDAEEGWNVPPETTEPCDPLLKVRSNRQTFWRQ